MFHVVGSPVCFSIFLLSTCSYCMRAFLLCCNPLLYVIGRVSVILCSWFPALVLICVVSFGASPCRLSLLLYLLGLSVRCCYRSFSRVVPFRPLFGVSSCFFSIYLLWLFCVAVLSFCVSFLVSGALSLCIPPSFLYSCICVSFVLSFYPLVVLSFFMFPLCSV